MVAKKPKRKTSVATGALKTTSEPAMCQSLQMMVQSIDTAIANEKQRSADTLVTLGAARGVYLQQAKTLGCSWAGPIV